MNVIFYIVIIIDNLLQLIFLNGLAKHTYGLNNYLLLKGLFWKHWEHNVFKKNIFSFFVLFDTPFFFVFHITVDFSISSIVPNGSCIDSDFELSASMLLDPFFRWTQYQFSKIIFFREIEIYKIRENFLDFKNP